MAKRLRRLVITEGSLVDRPANPGATVKLFKANGGTVMQDIRARLGDPGETLRRADVDQLIEDHLGEAYPGQTAGAVMLGKAWREDHELTTLYALRQEAEPDREPEAPVEKAREGAAWQEITKRAAELRSREPISQGESVAMVIEAAPELYKKYLEEQLGEAGDIED